MAAAALASYARAPHLFEQTCTHSRSGVRRPAVCTTQTSLFSASSRKRSVVISALPLLRPFEALPLELVEQILGHLELVELVKLKRVNSRFNALISSSRDICPSIALTWRATLLEPSALSTLAALLPGVRHLTLHSFPSPVVLFLLLYIDAHRLVYLDLSHIESKASFSRTNPKGTTAFLTEVDEVVLSRPRLQWPNLRTLVLQDCAYDSAFETLLLGGLVQPTTASLISPTPFPSLRHLNLSYASIFSGIYTTAHSSLTHAFPALISLNLAGTFSLARLSLHNFPPHLQDLNLSYVGLCPEHLEALLPCARHEREASETGHESKEDGQRAPLRLNLNGNDALTRRDITSLIHRWRDRHPQWPLDVVHDPVLLESDDEDDVRAFVEMLARATVARGTGP
ncbi:hypothetical protein JCM11251_006375 [Rhodosporidiobolus azoricus]